MVMRSRSISALVFTSALALSQAAVCLTPLLPAEGHAQEPPLSAPTGIVRITSSIPGATVYVDNELAGDAPIVRYLSAGPHFIRVAADNFDPFVRRVNVVAGSTAEIAADMIAGTGTVEFLVHPTGAKLQINAEEPVPTPMRLRDLKPGDYNYQLEAPGYETETGSFTFAKGKNLLFNVRMKSTAGLVEITSEPVGARVFLDGESRGVTPLQLEEVPLGEHTVRLELPDHATVFRGFDNSDGSKGKIAVDLGTAGAGLVVDTGSPTGAVRLNGHLLGEGEVVRVSALERGRYKLSVTAPERQPAEEVIDVPSRGKLMLRADLVTLDARGHSEIDRVKPLVARWTFWTGAAVGAGAVGGAGYLLANALTSDPTPTPDTVVVLP